MYREYDESKRKAGTSETKTRVPWSTFSGRVSEVIELPFRILILPTVSSCTYKRMDYNVLGA